MARPRQEDNHSARGSDIRETAKFIDQVLADALVAFQTSSSEKVYWRLSSLSLNLEGNLRCSMFVAWCCKFGDLSCADLGNDSQTKTREEPY